MYGGDLLFIDYKHKSRRDGERLIFDKTEKKVSAFSIVSFLVSFLIGCAAIRLLEFTKAGVVNVVLAALFTLILSILSFSLFIRTWRFSHNNSYSDLFKDAFDMNPIMITILIIISTLSLTVYFTGKVIQVWKSALKPFVSESNIFINDYFVGYIMFGMTYIVICTFGSFISFIPLCHIANICTVIAAIPLFINLNKSFCKNGFNPNGKIKMVTGDFWKTVDAITTFSMLYFVHPFIKFITKYSTNKTQNTIEAYAKISNIINFLYNVLCILAGYFLYENKVPFAFYFDLLDPRDTITFIAKISTVINLAITNAGYIKLFYHQIIIIFKIEDEYLFISFLCSAIAEVLSVGVSVYGGFFASTIDFLGNISFAIVTYIIPPIIYLKMFKLSNRWGYVAVFVLTCGIAILFISTWGNIRNTYLS